MAEVAAGAAAAGEIAAPAAGAEAAPARAPAGTAEKSSFAHRVSVAASGSALSAGSASVTPPTGTSPVGVCVVMVLADFDVIE